MARRMGIGLFGGTWDARISRPGYSVDTADVNNRSQISFSAARSGSIGAITEAGSISSINTWINFQKTYSNLPAVDYILNRAGGSVYGSAGNLSYVDGNIAVNRTGSEYVLVVEQTRFMITRPFDSNIGPVAAVSGDTFTYFVYGDLVT